MQFIDEHPSVKALIAVIAIAGAAVAIWAWGKVYVPMQRQQLIQIR